MSNNFFWFYHVFKERERKEKAKREREEREKLTGIKEKEKK
jgi:hypothetical protein